MTKTDICKALGLLRFGFCEDFKDTIALDCTTSRVYNMKCEEIEEFFDFHNVHDIRPYKKSSYAYIACPDDFDSFIEYLAQYSETTLNDTKSFTLDFGIKVHFYRKFIYPGETYFEITANVPVHVIRAMATIIVRHYEHQL